jgi:hypothetical protein
MWPNIFVVLAFCFQNALFLSANWQIVLLGGKAHENIVFRNYLYLASGFLYLAFLKWRNTCQQKTHIYYAVAARNNREK